jgi:hypothetical protein
MLVAERVVQVLERERTRLARVFAPAGLGQGIGQGQVRQACPARPGMPACSRRAISSASLASRSESSVRCWRRAPSLRQMWSMTTLPFESLRASNAARAAVEEAPRLVEVAAQKREPALDRVRGERGRAAGGHLALHHGPRLGERLARLGEVAHLGVVEAEPSRPNRCVSSRWARVASATDCR